MSEIDVSDAVISKIKTPLLSPRAISFPGRDHTVTTILAIWSVM